MVEAVVEDEEAVMKAVIVFSDLHLTTVLLLVQLLQMYERLADVLGVYRGIDPLASLLEQVEDGGIDVIVYQDDLPLRRLNERLHQFVGIKYLTFEQHALHRRQRSADEKVDLLLYLFQETSLFFYPLFQCHNPRIDDMASEQVFLQHPICPLSKLYTSFGIDAKSYRYDSIKIVEFYLSSDISIPLSAN